MTVTEAKAALEKMRKAYEKDEELFRAFDEALGTLQANAELSSAGKKSREQEMRALLADNHGAIAKDAASALDAFANASNEPTNIAEPFLSRSVEIVRILGEDVETSLLRELADNMQGRFRDLRLLEAVAIKCGCSRAKVDAAMEAYLIPESTVSELASEIDDAARRNRPLGLKFAQLLGIAESAYEPRDVLAYPKATPKAIIF